MAELRAPDCSECGQENYQQKTSKDRETKKPLAHDW
jgi:ribosomal protein L33